MDPAYAPYLRSCRDIKPITEEERNRRRNPELDECVLSLPNLAKQKFGSAAYAASAAAVWRLARGLSSCMRPPEVEQTRRAMVGAGLPPERVDWFLGHKWNREEREGLYALLNSHHDPENKSRGPKDLAGALRNPYTGFCLLMLLYLRPPKPKNAPEPTVPEDLKPAAALVDKFVQPFYSIRHKVGLIQSLKDHHTAKTAPALRSMQVTDGLLFVRWLAEFLESAYNKRNEEKLHPAALKTGSREFAEWEAEFMAESRRKRDAYAADRARRARLASEPQIEEVERAVDVYGEEFALANYPKELVDRAVRRLENL